MSFLLYCNNSNFKKRRKNNMKFFVLSHSQKKGNVGVAYIINWPHPFSLKIATPASLEISPTPPKKKNNLVYKKNYVNFT